MLFRSAAFFPRLQECTRRFAQRIPPDAFYPGEIALRVVVGTCSNNRGVLGANREFPRGRPGRVRLYRSLSFFILLRPCHLTRLLPGVPFSCRTHGRKQPALYWSGNGRAGPPPAQQLWPTLPPSSFALCLLTHAWRYVARQR